MTEYDNTNRGVIFKNDRKEKPTHPDYKGNLDVGGEQFWVSAWIKKGKNGDFISFSVKAKDAPRDMPPQNDVSGVDMDDNIPF